MAHKIFTGAKPFLKAGIKWYHGNKDAFLALAASFVSYPYTLFLQLTGLKTAGRQTRGQSAPPNINMYIN